MIQELLELMPLIKEAATHEDVGCRQAAVEALAEDFYNFEVMAQFIWGCCDRAMTERGTTFDELLDRGGDDELGGRR